MSSNAGTWEQFADEAPELAALVRARFEATKHHVLATLRVDGSPRVSGTEVQFHADGLYAGSMPESIKAKDLIRDGRFALHANPGDSTMSGGDAKVSGVATEVTEGAVLASYIDEVTPPQPFHLFQLLLKEVVLTSLHAEGDRLVIESWRPGKGVRRVERA
jgi:hypothetical protein